MIAEEFIDGESFCGKSVDGDDNNDGDDVDEDGDDDCNDDDDCDDDGDEDGGDDRNWAASEMRDLAVTSFSINCLKV